MLLTCFENWCICNCLSNFQSLWYNFRKVQSHAKVQPFVPPGSLGLCFWPSWRLLPTRWTMLAISGCNRCFCCIIVPRWKCFDFASELPWYFSTIEAIKVFISIKKSKRPKRVMPLNKTFRAYLVLSSKFLLILGKPFL